MKTKYKIVPVAEPGFREDSYQAYFGGELLGCFATRAMARTYCDYHEIARTMKPRSFTNQMEAPPEDVDELEDALHGMITAHTMEARKMWRDRLMELSRRFCAD